MSELKSMPNINTDYEEDYLLSHTGKAIEIMIEKMKNEENVEKKDKFTKAIKELSKARFDMVFPEENGLSNDKSSNVAKYFERRSEATRTIIDSFF